MDFRYAPTRASLYTREALLPSGSAPERCNTLYLAVQGVRKRSTDDLSVLLFLLFRLVFLPLEAVVLTAEGTVGGAGGQDITALELNDIKSGCVVNSFFHNILHLRQFLVAA